MIIQSKNQNVAIANLLRNCFNRPIQTFMQYNNHDHCKVARNRYYLRYFELSKVKKAELRDFMKGTKNKEEYKMVDGALQRRRDSTHCGLQINVYRWRLLVHIFYGYVDTSAKIR
jgi:hypothetical protein